MSCLKIQRFPVSHAVATYLLSSGGTGKE